MRSMHRACEIVGAPRLSRAEGGRAEEQQGRVNSNRGEIPSRPPFFPGEEAATTVKGTGCPPCAPVMPGLPKPIGVLVGIQLTHSLRLFRRSWKHCGYNVQICVGASSFFSA
jgi:hypothetical protein